MVQRAYLKQREIDKVGSFCAFYYKVGLIVSISKVLALWLVPECQTFWLALIEWWDQLPWEMCPASLIKSYDWSKLGPAPVTVCTPRVSNLVPAWAEVNNTIWLVHSVGPQYDWMSEVGCKHVVVGPKHVVSLGPKCDWLPKIGTKINNCVQYMQLAPLTLTIGPNTCNWAH